LSEPYFVEYQKRRATVIPHGDRARLFRLTQLLQQNWPKCMAPTVPPEVGTKHGIHYIKCDYDPSPHLRIAFGAHTDSGVVKIVALTCRTKEELGRDADRKWYKHMAMRGRDIWDEYLKGLIRTWKIY